MSAARGVGEGLSVVGADDGETASGRRGSCSYRPCSFHAEMCHPGDVSGKLRSLLSSLLPVDQIYNCPSISIA